MKESKIYMAESHEFKLKFTYKLWIEILLNLGIDNKNLGEAGKNDKFSLVKFK